MAEGGWSAAARSSETSFLSELQLLDLSLGICSIWTNVGTRLGLCTATLDNIAGTPALDTPQKRAFRMLTTWHRKQKNASVVQLISALVLEGREDLVQKCLAYQQGSAEYHPQSNQGVVQGPIVDTTGDSQMEHSWQMDAPRKRTTSASILKGHGAVKRQKTAESTGQYAVLPSQIAGPQTHFAQEFGGPTVDLATDSLVNRIRSWETDAPSTRQQAGLPSEIAGPQTNFAEEIEGILRDVREDYVEREKFLQPFPWCESHERCLENIYTEVKMVSRKRDRSKLTDKVCGMYDIFQPHEECGNPRVVLLEGDPGMGKTVFCQKLTYDWATGKTDGFMAEVDVLLKLQCRDLKNSDIEEAIAVKYLPTALSEECKKAFFNHIRVARSKVLFVVDGIDELKEGIDLSCLISGKLFPGCRLLLTSRSNEGLRRDCGTLLQVIGFTEEHAKDFIVKYFDDDEGKSRALLDRIRQDNKENGALRSLIRSPLNTILVCVVFQEIGGQLPVHTTHLYQEIVACIVRIRYKKKGEQPPADPVAEHKEELAALGRLALQGIKDDQLHFSEEDFQADDPATRILQFGFLSKRTSASVLKLRSSYQFLHKTVQEFLAAMCLHEQLTSGNFTCLSYLGEHTKIGHRFNPPSYKYKQVALFVAGLLSQDEAGRQLLPRFVSSLTRSLSAVDVRSSFLFICAVLRECVGCPHQELERVVVREFGWWRLELDVLPLDENSAEYRIAWGALRKENCPLKGLYLQCNNIHDGSQLTESLRDNTSLQFLSLEGNPLTADSASALARVLSAHPTLEVLLWPKEFRGEMEGRQHRNPLLEIYYY